jgi:hypothetical protein
MQTFFLYFNPEVITHPRTGEPMLPPDNVFPRETADRITDEFNGIVWPITHPEAVSYPMQ